MPEPDRAGREAAERLVREAHARAEAAARTVPPELLRPLAASLRDLLIAIRAVLDCTIERLERPPRVEREVEDIPIR